MPKKEGCFPPVPDIPSLSTDPTVFVPTDDAPVMVIDVGYENMAMGWGTQLKTLLIDRIFRT